MAESNGAFKMQTSREIGILQTDVKNLTKAVDNLQEMGSRMEAKLDSVNLLIAKWVGGGAVLIAVIEYLLLR